MLYFSTGEPPSGTWVAGQLSAISRSPAVAVGVDGWFGRTSG